MDMKDTQKNVQDMNVKINAIDRNQKEHETKTVTELEEIRNEIKTNNAALQETIMNNVLNQLQPKVTNSAELQETITNNVLNLLQPKVGEVKENLDAQDIK